MERCLMNDSNAMQNFSTFLLMIELEMGPWKWKLAGKN
jgi:hypothetical protein